MAEGHNRGPSVEVGTVRPPATRAGDGQAGVPSRALGSSLGRLGESVADAENREDESGRSRVGLDLLAHVLDVRINRPFVRLEGDSSDSVEELCAREYPA